MTGPSGSGIGLPDNSRIPDLADIRPVLPAPFLDLVTGRSAQGGLDGDGWLAALPRIVRECAQQWDLRASGPVRHGMAAVVVPCASALGPAVLKVSWPHPEAAQEHLALRAWDGQGSVRLLAADPSRSAMLLEPLDADRPLTSLEVDESCAVLGDLLRRLDRPALPQLALLSVQSHRWAQDLRTYGPALLPRRLVDRAAELLIDLGSEEGADARLVHTDLHDANVLAGTREPWLAIDPKPLAAVPEFGVAPLVWNGDPDARRSGSIRSHLRRRVEIACDRGGLDVDRAMLWTLARCALNVAWEAQERSGPESAVVSWWVTCCKAMQH